MCRYWIKTGYFTFVFSNLIEDPFKKNFPGLRRPYGKLGTRKEREKERTFHLHYGKEERPGQEYERLSTDIMLSTHISWITVRILGPDVPRYFLVFLGFRYRCINSVV